MSIVKDTIAITAITLVAGLALGVVQDITAGPIAQQQEQSKQEAYKAVFEDADSFEVYDVDADALAANLAENNFNAQTINEIMEAKDASGETIDGTLNGISILSISETAGLGMKAKNPDFQDQFKDKNVEKFEYTKTGATSDDQIDAISGATITTNAMTNGVNAGLCAFRYVEGGAES